MNSRIIRISAATLLIGAAGVTLWPQVTSYVSTSAVVNAPVVRVKAPFDGTVTSVSVGRSGTIVQRDERLLELEQARPETGRITDITAEGRVIEGEIAALESQIAAVEEIASNLTRRIHDHSREAGARIAAKRQVVSADTRRARARLDFAEGELERIDQLALRGTAPERDLDAARMRLAAARAELDRLRSEAEELEIVSAALEKGIMLDPGPEGAGFARQRLDEVALSLADLRARLGVLESCESALAIRRAETKARFAAQHAFVSVAAIDGVVWRPAPEIGSEVSAGDVLLEIVNYDHRFLEVSIPERHFERIGPGDEAEVQLKGSATPLTATVSAVGGSSARLNDQSFAAGRSPGSAGSAQVLLDLPPMGGESGEIASFCNVGRSAEVRFPRDQVGSFGRQIAALYVNLRNRIL